MGSHHDEDPPRLERERWAEVACIASGDWPKREPFSLVNHPAYR